MLNYTFLCLRKSEDFWHHIQQRFVAFNLTLCTYTDKDTKQLYNGRKNYIGVYMVNCLSRVASTFIVSLNNAIVIRFNLTDETYFSDFKAPSVSESDFGSL